MTTASCSSSVCLFAAHKTSLKMLTANYCVGLCLISQWKQFGFLLLADNQQYEISHYQPLICQSNTYCASIINVPIISIKRDAQTRQSLEFDFPTGVLMMCYWCKMTSVATVRSTRYLSLYDFLFTPLGLLEKVNVNKSWKQPKIGSSRPSAGTSLSL